MQKRLYTIVGGSGAGKSTVTNRLISHYPDNFHVIRLEDFYLPFDQIPVRYRGRPNLDVIESFDIPKFHAAIKSWADDNTDHRAALVEGFLAHTALPADRSFEKYCIYLEAPHDLRFSRRQGEMKDKQYEREVLIPMHTRFVEAQREAADLVIEVSDKTADEVELMILEFIQKDVFTGSTR